MKGKRCQPQTLFKTRPGNLVDATSPRWKLWEAKTTYREREIERNKGRARPVFDVAIINDTV